MLKSKVIKTFSLAIALTASYFVPAHSAPETLASANPQCIAPDYSKAGHPTWFLDIYPMDDLIAVWCRIQKLPGNIKFNILFPVTNVHRSWETSFESGLPPEQIHKIVQSLLPLKDGPAADENGMEFHKVLQKVIQLQAPEAPSGFTFGFPSDHPSSREMVLWEPITLRVRPVVLAGQEFVLSVNLKPSLGMLALALQKQATDLTFHGWKGRMNTGGFLGTTCSSQFPDCEAVPEIASFHAPWIVYSVRLDTTGENMTQSAVAIMNKLSAGKIQGTLLGPDINTNTGEGKFSVENEITKMSMVAKGSSSGTSSIEIVWEAKTGTGTIDDQLRKLGEAFRSGDRSKEKRTDVPDVLNQL